MIKGYQILDKIYENANSIVYRGKQEADGLSVIIKVLQVENLSHQDTIQFNNEVELTKNLNVLGIRKAIGTFQEEGKSVLVLEYIEGKTLKQILSESPPTQIDCIKIVCQFAEILSQVHKNKIIHKDINPNNLIITNNQKVYLIDFGISSKVSLKISNLGNPDKIEGTLAYISPEQTGRMNRFVNHSTDLYSLGITLYEMITGRLPFESDDPMELVHSHIAKSFPLPSKIKSNIPNIVEQIILKLLSKNAEDRYQSAIGLKYDLEKYLNGQTDFELGQLDFSGIFSIPQKLYGREIEIQKLMQAFERISQTSNQASKLELVLISGYSGVGKTALVHEIHKPITSQRGHFIEGKFDQFQRNVPYFGLVQAFEEFIQLILTYNQTELEFWKQKIIESVGTIGKVLTELVPSLVQVIGEQPNVPTLEGAAAQNRFNSVLTRFLKAISMPEHPLVLFIDDWQWADQPSIQLLETILSQQEIQNLLVIAAYRDNEVDSTHPFMTTLQNIQKMELKVETVQLANLSFEHLQNLLVDSLQDKTHLSTMSKQIQEFSNLIYTKTGGNAFFIGQFLISLYEEELLKFDFDELEWKWNIEQINAKGFTDNVVELMVKKIQKLPSHSAKVLQLASCIGSHFDLDRLSIITKQESINTNLSLEPAILEGLITPNHIHFKHVDPSILEYHFAHDRIQQAAYTLIPESEKQPIHLQIGQLLLESLETSPNSFVLSPELEEQIFEITNHWNKGIDLIRDSKDKITLSYLNLHASTKAKKSLAYKEALHFAETGVQLLETNSWTTQYDLTLALYLKFHECLFLTTNFEKANQVFGLIIQNAKKKTEAIESYLTKISQDTMQGNYADAIQSGFDILSELGVHLSEDKIMEDMQEEAKQVQITLAGKDTSELSKLQMADSKEIILISKIYSVLMPTAFFSNPFLNFLIVMKTINMALAHGTTNTMAFSLACSTLPFIALFNDYKRGYDFAMFAIDLAKKYNDVYGLGNSMHVFALFTQHWGDHLHKNIPMARQAFLHLTECGDMQMAGYTFFDVLDTVFGSGEPLHTLMKESNTALSYLTKTKNFHAHTSLIVYKQLALCLQNQTKSTDSFGTDDFSEQEHLKSITGNMMALVYYHIYKLVALYLSGHYESAQLHSEESEKIIQFITGFYPTAIWNFYASLNNCKLADLSTSPEQKESYLSRTIQNQKQMKVWTENAPMNFLHKYHLVEAEVSRVLDKNWEATKFYEQAIAGAKQNQFLHEKALGYELGALFFIKQNIPVIATQYLTKSREIYTKWGASGKVDQIEKSYPNYLAKQNKRSGSTVSSTTGTMTLEYMDMSSILKASQSILGEIVIEKLLRKLMQTVLENAGAEIGFLLLPKNDIWYIEVEGKVGEKEIQRYEKPVEETEKVSLRILNYVIHSQKPVVLDNAIREGQFANDPFLVSQESKSVLCTPLLNQGKLIGVLYLENKMTIGAFTPARLEILNVLASQAAISLENAVLYNTLEQKVEERTAELKQERDKSEELLLNILPEEVAKELKENGFVKPVHYESVSVLFTDLKGFTKVAESMSAEDLVKELDASFHYFDDIITKYDLEKIKTIGDSYMCAGGLPERNNTHSIDACLAGLEIQQMMNLDKEKKKSKGLPYWELRLGIHTGPVIAGVVGKKKFAYDIWGDTVNIASRMESSGDAGKINVSKEVFDQVKYLFSCEYRGKVNAKNKGEIDMYFVLGLKPEYSMDKNNREPNDLFWKEYARIQKLRIISPN